MNKYFSGWTAGAGVSVAFAQNWNVFAEYRYTSFGSTTLALPLSELSTTSTTKVSAIELGVNYKFNPRAPAVPVSGVGIIAVAGVPCTIMSHDLQGRDHGCRRLAPRPWPGSRES